MRIKITLFLLIIGLGALKAQDPVYSQFYNAPLQLNPALAGNNTLPFFTGNVRVQWPNLPFAYTTYSASYDQYLPGSNSGIGITLLNDSAGEGTLRNTKISGIYSYNLKIDRTSYVRGGVEVGIISRRLDWDKLIFGDAIDPQFGGISPGGTPFPSREVQPANTSITSLDLSFGILYYSPQFYGGIAIDHLNNPRDEFFSNEEKNFQGIPMRFTLHGGTEINIDKRNKNGLRSFVSPHLLFVSQGDFWQINAGIYGEINSFIGGIGYRHAGINPDALITSFGFRSGSLKIMYSFDLTVSDLSINQGGGHELGLIINLNGDEKNKKVDVSDCLNIFR